MHKALSILLSLFCLFSAVSCSSLGLGEDKGSKWDRTTALGSRSSRQVVPVRTTAYTHTEADHIEYSNKTAIGTRLKYYSGVRSAAADWSKYPVGTRFQIVGQPGVTYEIDDYGSALVGKNTIDLYKPNRSVMNAWGARDVQIRIVRWGSYQRSKEILKDRTGYSHVRRMYDALASKA